MRFYFPSNFFALHRLQPTFRRQNKIGSLDGITLQVQVVIKTFFEIFECFPKHWSTFIKALFSKSISKFEINPPFINNMTTKLGFHLVVQRSGWWVDDTLTMTMVVFGELQKNVFIQSRTLLTTHPCSSRCINTIPGGIQWKNLSLFSFSPHMHYGTWSPGKPWHWFPREN